MNRRAYLDHASTSLLRPAALEAMLPWMSSADPGRVHTEGRMARFALEDAREQIASLFATRPRQVIFTSGATESINSAVFGALTAHPGTIVCPAVEHSAVREASERYGTSVRLIGADRTGRISVAELSEALKRRTQARTRGQAQGQDDDQGEGQGRPVRLVQCQLANHEVGTIQPVEQVAQVVHDMGADRPLLHVDAAAAAGYVPIRFDDLGVDLMSVSAHKIGGPVGVGALLVRRGLRIPPFVLGGSQERARRGGLENVPAAIGFGAVAEILSQPGAMAAEAARASSLAERLRSAVSSIPDVDLYGAPDPAERLPHLVCLGVGGVEAEPVLIALDQAGVAAHSGSSCSSEALEPSPVLEAMGVNADHSLRLSVGWSTTDADVDLAAGALPEIVERLRTLRA